VPPRERLEPTVRALLRDHLSPGDRAALVLDSPTVTQPTPPADPQDEPFRAAEWVQKNTLTIASIEGAAADLLVQMKAVAQAHEDPRGVQS
jgi:hypothetical protein